MYFLKPISIECIDQNEISQDEPYLLFNGTRIWSGDMSQGQSIRLDYLDAIPFGQGGAATLSLYEDDGDHWYDRNDYIGSTRLSGAQEPGGAFSRDFTGGDAHYRVYMDVQRASTPV